MAAVDEFELVDDDVEQAPAVERSRRKAHPLPWVAASVALMLIGAVAATPFPVVPGRGDGLELGLVDLDLSVEPTVAWESLGLEYPEIVDTAGDRAVIITSNQGDSRTYLGLDLADGTEVWRYFDGGNTCQYDLPLVCIEGAGSPSAQIVLLDTDDGSLTTRAHPSAISATVAGDDLVVIEDTDRADEDVVLVEPDGSERWRVAVDAADELTFPVWAPMWISGTSVSLGVSGVTLDLETGEQTTQTFPTWNGLTLQMQDDGSTLVTGPEGSFTLSADEGLLQYDDDLGGPVRLEYAETGVVASLRSDGTELWRSAGPDCFPTGRLRGVVIMQCYGPQTSGLVGIDEITGERLWHLPGTSWVVAASREHLVALDEVQDVVIGVDPRDGTVPWSVPMDGGSPMGSAIALDDGLLVATETEVMRLVWD